MTTFPEWTGPEADARYAAAAKICDLRPDYVAKYALRQLMVDLNMPAPKDEAEDLWSAIVNSDDVNVLALIRAAKARWEAAALAKARGDKS